MRALGIKFVGNLPGLYHKNIYHLFGGNGVGSEIASAKTRIEPFSNVSGSLKIELR
jgi:hypothetical protein